MLDFLNMAEKKRCVLKAIISEYILTAEPVGSSAISGRYMKDVSSATIRNVMAELEELGFLDHPHTSAGRVPTDRGFRAYVDHLMQPKTLLREDKEEIMKACNPSMQEVPDLIKDVSRILSSISHHTGLAVFPKFSDTTLRHIEFVRLNGKRLLVVIVSRAGTVQNRLIELEEELKQSDLDRMTGYLNELFSGLTLSEVRKRLLEEMRKEKNLYDRLFKKALNLGKEILGNTDTDAKEVFIEGQSRFFEHPEFLDIERMKEIFKAFEEKSTIIRLLDKSLKAKGVHIFIGYESGLSELKECSLITASYGMDGRISGSFGVIGPIRMDYSRIIPLVDYTAKLVEKMLKEASSDGRV